MAINTKSAPAKKKQSSSPTRNGAREVEDARERMISAAMELFAEKGYEGMTVRDLAAAAGVNVAAVNYHFGSKDALYHECLRSCLAPATKMRERMQTHLDAALKAKSKKIAEKTLRACVQIFLEELMHPDSKHMRLVMREQAVGGPQFERIIREFFEPIGKILQQVIFMLAPGLPQMQVFMVISGVIGHCLHTQKARATIRFFAGVDSHSPEYIEAVSAHIAHFTVLGLRGLEREKGAS
jgi:TetR/AcrR family transcriptional regulator, regulator of cefoperazone and chloramphenicol sensitivity